MAAALREADRRGTDAMGEATARGLGSARAKHGWAALNPSVSCHPGATVLIEGPLTQCGHLLGTYNNASTAEMLMIP